MNYDIYDHFRPFCELWLSMFPILLIQALQVTPGDSVLFNSGYLVI